MQNNQIRNHAFGYTTSYLQSHTWKQLLDMLLDVKLVCSYNFWTYSYFAAVNLLSFLFWIRILVGFKIWWLLLAEFAGVKSDICRYQECLDKVRFDVLLCERDNAYYVNPAKNHDQCVVFVPLNGCVYNTWVTKCGFEGWEVFYKVQSVRIWVSSFQPVCRWIYK